MAGQCLAEKAAATGEDEAGKHGDTMAENYEEAY